MTPNVEFFAAEPLDAQGISDFLHKFGGSWGEVAVLATVDSTNTELARAISVVQPGVARIVIAEEQTEGLGRLGRKWSSSYGKGIALSIGVAVSDIQQELSALPLIVGLAVSRALESVGVRANLKWPNDVIFENTDGSVRKCGGILVQRVDHALVIGIGINVTHQSDELPTEIATSLILEGYRVSRNELAAQIINEVERALLAPSSWIEDYEEKCSSIGRDVIVHQISSEQLIGKAISVLPSGALILATDGAEVEVTIGDVEHATIS